MNSTPPWSRTRCTQPMSTVLRPPSMPESSPQVCVRFKSPSGSMRTLAGWGAGTVVVGIAVASAGGRGASTEESAAGAAEVSSSLRDFPALVIRVFLASSGARDWAAQRLLQCLLEVGLAHAPLLAAPEILDRGLAGLGFVLSENQR